MCSVGVCNGFVTFFSASVHFASFSEQADSRQIPSRQSQLFIAQRVAAVVNQTVKSCRLPAKIR